MAPADAPDRGPAQPGEGSAPPRERTIRSFGTRGHRSDRAREICERLLPRYGIAPTNGPVDLPAAFGRRARTIVEVGFGMGETTAEIAAADPASDFVGIDVYPPGVARLLLRIEQRGLTNLRVIQRDAVDVMREMIRPDSLDAIHVFFPDPWPKKRHHKRRLIQPPVAALFASRLVAGGYLHCATDWEAYAQQMLEVLSAEPRLANTADGFAQRPAHRPLTKFEQRGLALGHRVWDLVFVRRGA